MGSSSNVVQGSATLSINSVDVGFTKDGVRTRAEREYLDVAADQQVGLVKKPKTMERMFVETTLLEATLANLYRAWDMDINTLGSTAENEVALEIVGKAPLNGTRTISLDRAVSIGAAELNYSREEEAALEVQFECLKNNAGLFGTLADS